MPMSNATGLSAKGRVKDAVPNSSRAHMATSAAFTRVVYGSAERLALESPIGGPARCTTASCAAIITVIMTVISEASRIREATLIGLAGVKRQAITGRILGLRLFLYGINKKEKASQKTTAQQK